MIKITVNGKNKPIVNGSTVNDNFDANTVVIADGYQVGREYVFIDGDNVIAIDKHSMPTAEQLESMTFARNGVKVNEAIKNARILIAGLGGIGSNLAVNLTRLGISNLHLIDYDTVDASNLNRQSYYVRDIGEYKTAALAKQLKEINPYIKIKADNIKIDENNAKQIITNCDIVCECFDNPQCKAIIVNTALECGRITVACSGMAGYGKAEEIRIKRAMNKLYIAGDGQSEAAKGFGLMAPRVAVCAGIMANAVLRLLLGEEP